MPAKSKAKTSPAPATKSVKPAAKKKLVVAALTAATAEKPAPAPKAAKRAAAPAAAPVARTTTIAARIDVGFGNALFLRGAGAGLSWERGVPMTCVADDRWEIVLPAATAPFTVKFLVNDLTWSTGADYTVAAGESVTLTPEF